MIFRLDPVLSPVHTPIEEEFSIDFTEFVLDGKAYQVVASEPVHLKVSHIKGQEIHIEGETCLTLRIPCDRCLEDTEETFRIVCDEIAEADGPETDETKNYINGYELDVNQLLFNELLVGWPIKVLCSEDCEGLYSTCEEAEPDPRMSAIREIYQQVKEV